MICVVRWLRGLSTNNGSVDAAPHVVGENRMGGASWLWPLVAVV